MELTKYLYIPALLSLLASCAAEDFRTSDQESGKTLTVNMQIEKTNITRADANDEGNDGWSYTGFAEGDILGFYSEHGDLFVDNGEGPFVNLPLTNTGGTQFQSPDNTQFSPSHMSSTGLYLYYPYSPAMSSTDPDIPATGIELRTVKEGDPDGILRCIDYLSAKSVDASALNFGQLTGSFLHTFSELIIMRGEGFDNPPEGCEGITVYLTQPYTHIRINNPLDPWSCTPELYNLPGYTPTGYQGTDFDPYAWVAWQGGNYGATQENPEGYEAWYVMLPSLGTGAAGSTVDYIEIYDNEGIPQKVSSLKLAQVNNVYTKYISSTWKYPILVSMKELVPSVNPFPIEAWEGDTDLTNQRERGISNLLEFNLWRGYYAAYLQDGEYSNELLKYGDRIVDANGNFLYWHFYLLGDIDFSNNPDETITDAMIPVLQDILDGVNMNMWENNTRPNYNITGLTVPLVGQLKDKGQLLNMNFQTPRIELTTTTAAGILANSMTGGATINNCNIYSGTLISNGPVGIVAGDVSTGNITGCSASGFLIGTSSLEAFGYAVGSQSGVNNIEENDFNDVIFTQR